MPIIGVSGQFTATHVCVEESAHPHTWEVMAWFSVSDRTDARCYRASLDALLSAWDGGALPSDIEWGEDIARAVGTLVNCVEVIVSRPDERIHAKWRR